MSEANGRVRQAGRMIRRRRLRAVYFGAVYFGAVYFGAVYFGAVYFGAVYFGNVSSAAALRLPSTGTSAMAKRMATISSGSMGFSRVAMPLGSIHRVHEPACHPVLSRALPRCCTE